MWLVLVLLATYVGASSPWGEGIWPRWPAHPEEGRVEQVVTGTLHMMRLDNTQLGQPTVFHHSPVLQRKENVQRGQKETRERYKEPASRDGRGSYFCHGAGRGGEGLGKKSMGRGGAGNPPFPTMRGGEGVKICGMGRGRGGEHAACIS